MNNIKRIPTVTDSLGTTGSLETDRSMGQSSAVLLGGIQRTMTKNTLNELQPSATMRSKLSERFDMPAIIEEKKPLTDQDKAAIALQE